MTTYRGARRLDSSPVCAAGPAQLLHHATGHDLQQEPQLFPMPIHEGAN